MNELTIILLMSLFCVGLFLAMQKDQVLSFMRQWAVDRINKEKEENQSLRDGYKSDYSNKKISTLNLAKEEGWTQEQIEHALANLRTQRDKDMKWCDDMDKATMTLFKFLKPFILCVWCFASFWGSIAFWSIHWVYLKNVRVELIPIWVISCFGCLVLNAVIDSLLRKLDIL